MRISLRSRSGASRTWRSRARDRHAGRTGFLAHGPSELPPLAPSRWRGGPVAVDVQQHALAVAGTARQQQAPLLSEASLPWVVLRICWRHRPTTVPHTCCNWANSSEPGLCGRPERACGCHDLSRLVTACEATLRVWRAPASRGLGRFTSGLGNTRVLPRARTAPTLARQPAPRPPPSCRRQHPRSLRRWRAR